MSVIRNLTIEIEHTGKKIPVEEVDSSVTTHELLNALAGKINLPSGTKGVLIGKVTRKQLQPHQSLGSAGIEDGETFIADFERTAGGNVQTQVDDVSNSNTDIAGSDVNNGGDLSIIFGNEIGRSSRVYPSFSQEFIITTSDKLRLSLVEFQEASKARTDWITPFGILLALVSTLVAADFKDFLGMTPDTWQAIFISGSVICFLWLLWAVYQAIRYHSKSNIDYVIQAVKRSGKYIEK